MSRQEYSRIRRRTGKIVYELAISETSIKADNPSQKEISWEKVFLSTRGVRLFCPPIWNLIKKVGKG